MSLLPRTVFLHFLTFVDGDLASKLFSVVTLSFSLPHSLFHGVVFLGVRRSENILWRKIRQEIVYKVSRTIAGKDTFPIITSFITTNMYNEYIPDTDVIHIFWTLENAGRLKRWTSLP